MKPRCKW